MRHYQCCTRRHHGTPAQQDDAPRQTPEDPRIDWLHTVQLTRIHASESSTLSAQPDRAPRRERRALDRGESTKTTDPLVDRIVRELQPLQERSSVNPAAEKSPSKASASRMRELLMKAKLVPSTNECSRSS